MSNRIEIAGAKTHNLQNVDLAIPHNQLTVITGVSGSGKSSLAIDTLFAEGQRQYIESLSIYARQFLNQLQRPDVESIRGLQPTLCIDQKAGLTNPRSTVATVTEVYDYLRLLMARVGTPSCPECGTEIAQQSSDRILSELKQLPPRTKLMLLAPVVRGKRGSHREELSAIRKAGLVRARVDGAILELDEIPDLAPRKHHTIEAVVDKIVVREDIDERLTDSIALALRLSDGLVIARTQERDTATDQWRERLFSTKYACPSCDISLEELEPRTFSFNSPYGACPACEGFGLQLRVSAEHIIANWDKPLGAGAMDWLEDASSVMQRRIKKLLLPILESFSLSWKDCASKLTAAQRKRLLHGNAKTDGIASILQEFVESCDDSDQDCLIPILSEQACQACNGGRLTQTALSVHLNGKNIFEICSLHLKDTLSWIQALDLTGHEEVIAAPILAEMLHRLKFLNQVGVGYLTLARSADSLSGGELQRVRLATSIGSGLVGVSYILDEPSIGLHPRDNDRLIASLRDLQRQGNTVLVVEHDEAMMRSADVLVDVGPGAGKQGGKIIASGSPKEVEQAKASVTGTYLRGDKKVQRNSPARPKAKQKNWVHLKGASLNNLKGVDLDIPLGRLVGVAGVSGSGKSSLISRTLVPAILNRIGQARRFAGDYRLLRGAEQIDKLIEITQAPIGRSPRSTPATYCGAFDLIRKVWAGSREAKQRGFTASRFSFNSGAGRCSRCQGQGQEKIEMQFLPDLSIVCADCQGMRYNRQTLQVRYRGKSIADVLRMSITEAADFFANFEKIRRLLQCLVAVGLGYLELGQSSATLSGGEAQRIKLATELAKPDTGNTIYFLDEPTTGLHFADVQRLIDVLDGLVEKGNTVIVIEHNTDVLTACDWLIELGPEGGAAGGKIIASGVPATLRSNPVSLTGAYL